MIILRIMFVLMIFKLAIKKVERSRLEQMYVIKSLKGLKNKLCGICNVHEET